MSRDEQRAAGAAAGSRGQTAGYAERARAEEAGSRATAAADAAYERIGGSDAGGRNYSHGTPPRTVSQREASDVQRYQQMRQQRTHGGHEGGNGGGSRKLGLKIFGGVVAALAAVLVIFLVVITIRPGDGIDAATRAKLTPSFPGQPFYMLLVGTDKSEEREETDATGGTYRTDSIILARVDPLAAKLTLVSIQRDTLVDLGDYGQQKINAAYTFGGAPLLIDTVSKLAGVGISHYAEIDFDSFVSVVDALGGIEVNVPIDIDDDLAEVHLSAGEQTINGAEALGLCRARHAYDEYGAGDYYRTANQRMVLGAILRKALSGNPASLLATIDAASNSVSTTLTGFDLAFLGLRFIGFNMDEDLYSGMTPTTSSYINGTWYELLDTTTWQAMMARVDQGLSPYSDASQDTTAGLAGNTGAIAN